MTVSIYNCWACGKKITHDRDPDDCFFWCNKSCEEAYHVRTTQNGKALKDWSAYMAGEKPCPKGMEPHPADLETGFRVLGKKKRIKPEKTEKSLKAAAIAAFSKKKAKKAKKGPKRVRKMKDSGRRTVICGNCGTPGHNSRTCSE